MNNFGSIELTMSQTRVFNSITRGRNQKRFNVLCWARRSGKNFIMMILLAYKAIESPGCKSMFVAKNSDSARRTAFQPFMKLCLDQLGTDSGIKFNASTMEVTFPNGSIIMFKSGEVYDSLRGEEIDGYLIMDEIDFQRNFFDGLVNVLRPMTSRTKAQMIFTSTPFGLGFPLHTLWLQGQQEEEDFFLHHVDAYHAGTLDKEEVDSAKRMMSDHQFRQEYMAEFVSAAARVYPKFNEDNIIPLDDLEVELHVGLDHNVSLSTAVIGQMNGDTFEVIDCISKVNSNTREMAISIKARFPNRDITVYPDPSGKARKTSAEMGITDHIMLEQEGLKVIAPKKAPLIVDRINCVNNLILTADGTRKLFINKSNKACAVLTESLSYHLYDPDKGQPFKGSLDHYDDTNDSLGYVLWNLYKNAILGRKTTTVVNDDFFG